MAKNEFLPFGIADGANVLSNDEYGNLSARTNGFSSGVAKSQELNKVWRQASVIANVVAQFIAETNNQDVLDDGNTAALQKGLLNALRATVGSNIPVASQTVAGIAKLSNATNSEAENVAATPKAVKQAADMANQARTEAGNANATANTANQNAGNAITNANNANNNANTRLEKNQNGADIPNKPEFVDNLGLTDTVDRAASINITDEQVSLLSPAKKHGLFISLLGWSGVEIDGDKKWLVDNNGELRRGRIPISTGGTGAGTVLGARHNLGVYGKTEVDLMAVPIGAPIPYPTATPPEGFKACNGDIFDKSQYPILALLYPTGRLPDLRSEFIRGWDNGRKVDNGRGILTEQSDAMQPLTGHLHGVVHYGDDSATGVFDRESSGAVHLAGTGNLVSNHRFDSSRLARTANETRPRNIAFNYIVRVA